MRRKSDKGRREYLLYYANVSIWYLQGRQDILCNVNKVLTLDFAAPASFTLVHLTANLMDLPESITTLTAFAPYDLAPLFLCLEN